MLTTPKGNSLHIGIFGRRNVGKSSLMNALVKQDVAIVSALAGTTTDPVEKKMELQPIGPVLFIDTAGVDDEGLLGKLRIAKTEQVFDRTDVAILVCETNLWGHYEKSLYSHLKERNIPIVVAVNKCDLAEPDPKFLDLLREERLPFVTMAVTRQEGIDGLREALIHHVPIHFITDLPILGDLIAPSAIVMLVTPIDMEAPKGRLILPQVQSIRDILDHDAMCMVVKERELKQALASLARPPALVVTDSQAFLKVAADTPAEIPMTSFSILFARHKGDLSEMVRGAMMIEKLQNGDRVLICEACTHHPIGDDIGRVKIPRWLRGYVGSSLEFEHFQGLDFPKDLTSYKLIIHCGGCVHNRRHMLTRIMRAKQQQVPITNYGLAIAYSLGVFDRALKPFHAAYEVYRSLAREPTQR